MTTIRQLIQTSPAKANELFAEIKTELEFLAKLEEQHLFPVLRKHRETKKLAAEALGANHQTRKLLSDLERTPKDSEKPSSSMLTDDEAETVVEKIQDKKAEVHAARRAETEERRSIRRMRIRVLPPYWRKL